MPGYRASGIMLLLGACGGGSGAESFAKKAFLLEYHSCVDGMYRTNWWHGWATDYFKEIQEPVITAESLPLSASDSAQHVEWRGLMRIRAARGRVFQRIHEMGRISLPDVWQKTHPDGWQGAHEPALDIVLPLRRMNGQWEPVDWSIWHDGETTGPPTGCGSVGQ